MGNAKEEVRLKVRRFLDAVIDAHAAMSHQALDSAKIRDGLRDVLLGPGELYEGLRERAGREAAPV